MDGFCRRPFCYVRRCLVGTQTDLNTVVKGKLEYKNRCSLLCIKLKNMAMFNIEHFLLDICKTLY